MNSSAPKFYNPNIAPLMQIIDQENGRGYSQNIKNQGMIIRIPNSTTQMLYEVMIKEENIKLVFVRYIHYENKRQLLTLLAFAAQWWMRLEPNMIYFSEKSRKNGAGKYLKLLGFHEDRVKNKLRPFHCMACGGGDPCVCPVYEYYIYGVKKRKKATKPVAQQRKAPAKHARPAARRTPATIR